MKPKQYEPTVKLPVETPEMIKQALSRFKEFEVASERTTFANDTDSGYAPIYTGAIVTTDGGVKSALIICSPGHLANDQDTYVGYVPCNIPVAFSAKEALELPAVLDPIVVHPGDISVDRLRDAIQQSCTDAHAFYIDGLLDLDDQLEL